MFSEKIIHTVADMHAFGQELAQSHQLLLLNGELGAGKTTLAKGFAAGHGIDPDQVKSPTYTYMQVYDEKLLHIDMRRITDIDHAAELGVRDMIDSYDHIMIERPKFTQERMHDSRLQVTIQKQPNDVRLLSVGTTSS